VIPLPLCACVCAWCSPVPGYVAPFIYDNDLGSGWGWMPYKSKNTIVSHSHIYLTRVHMAACVAF
jgi:hypothetical protein